MLANAPAGPMLQTFDASAMPASLPLMAAPTTHPAQCRPFNSAGMLYLHTRSPAIYHRDLKSANLLVTSQYQVKVRACAWR